MTTDEFWKLFKQTLKEQDFFVPLHGKFITPNKAVVEAEMPQAALFSYSFQVPHNYEDKQLPRFCKNEAIRFMKACAKHFHKEYEYFWGVSEEKASNES